MRSLEQVNIRTNVRTYVLTYIRTGQTLYPLHNFVVRGDNYLIINYFILFDKAKRKQRLLIGLLRWMTQPFQNQVLLLKEPSLFYKSCEMDPFTLKALAE